VTKNFGFRRGEIYFADLDPHYGSEQGGKRPVIIIQNDVGNKFAPTVIVAAVTSRVSKKPNQPTHVLIDKNPAFSRPSVVLLEQIFTIDKERINNFMGLTSEWEMKQIEEALLRSLGIDIVLFMCAAAFLVVGIVQPKRSKQAGQDALDTFTNRRNAVSCICLGILFVIVVICISL